MIRSMVEIGERIMPKVTVIMPSLNVVKYIEACIESVLAQTLQDIEVLVIDAGSDDGTIELLQKYAALDTRIRIIHSDRKSYGYQMNLGIALAQGEYIGVVETDDMIEPAMYMTLYNTAVETDADYVKGRAELFIELTTGTVWRQPIGSPLNTDMIGQVISPRTMPGLLIRDIYLWTGIYKSKFVKQIILNETSGAAFQDQGFLFQTISAADRAVYLDGIFYQYRQDNSGSSIYNQKGFHYLVEEYGYIEKFLTDKDEDWRSVYYQRMLNQCLGRFRTMAASGFFWEEAVTDMEILRDRLAKAVKNGILRSDDIDDAKWNLLKLFLSGNGDIYFYYRVEYQKKVDIISRLLEIVSHRQMIIFGCGGIGKYFHALLDREKPGQIKAFCDNNNKLWSTYIQGIVVLSPEDAVRQYPDAVYVIANLKSVEAIKRQLQTLGISKEHIYLFQEMTDVLLLRLSPQ